jgi:hypothetical protein
VEFKNEKFANKIVVTILRKKERGIPSYSLDVLNY